MGSVRRIVVLAVAGGLALAVWLAVGTASSAPSTATRAPSALGTTGAAR
jgi:hypothetical protein